MQYEYPYINSFGYNRRNTFSSSSHKRRNISKRQSRFYSNANGNKNGFKNKKVRAIWIRKDDVNSQLRFNVVLTAYNAVEHSSQSYLDNGCSRHMSGDKNIFTTLKNYH